MAPGYLNWNMTGTWGQNANGVGFTANSYVAQPVTYARLWENLRDRDRYELARVRRILIAPPRVLAMFVLPRVRMYVLRINAAGRPGRRRRRLAVTTA